MSSENAPEVFQPLVTQVNAMPQGQVWLDEPNEPGICADLPHGLGVLARAGSRLRRSLLVALALLAVSLVELGALLLHPGPSPLVVWEERPVNPLVEVP
jgi:hypothetical protein